MHDDDAFEAAVESRLEDLLADPYSIDEAICECAVSIRTALLAGTPGYETVAAIRAIVRGYLRAEAERYYERRPDLYAPERRPLFPRAYIID